MTTSRYAAFDLARTNANRSLSRDTWTRRSSFCAIFVASAVSWWGILFALSNTV